MLNIVIFGAPGSGKGTQSDLMIKKYGLKHISTGDVLRSEIKNETKLGKIAKSYMDNGQLVPDSLIIDILSSVLDSKGENINGVIFDGFPRTIAQAEALNKMLEERDESVSAVIGLEVEDDELVNRIVARGKTSGRSDDNEATARKRLETYYSQTLPLKDFYLGENKYVTIQGQGNIEDIFADIERTLDTLI